MAIDHASTTEATGNQLPTLDTETSETALATMREIALVSTSRLSDQAAAEAAERLSTATAILEITTADAYTDAVQRQRECRDDLDLVKADVELIAKPKKEFLAMLNERAAKVITPLAQADKHYTKLTTAYEEAAERARKAEEDRLRREAEAKAREQAERDAKALERQAERESKKGNKGVARELKEQAEATRTAEVHVSVHVESSVPTVAGMTSKKSWQAEVYDLRKLVEAVYRGWVEIEALQPAETYLNGMARGRKAGMNAIDPKTKRLPYPGVRAVEKPYKARTRGGA